MAEESERIQETFEYTYTIDEFIVFFYGGHIYVGGKEYPIRQCSVDIMNLDEPVLDEIDRRAECAFLKRLICSQKKQTAPRLSRRRD